MRIAVVDDHDSVRAILATILSEYGLDVVSVCANGREAVEASRELKPDAVVMDVRMPVLDGIAATREIKQVSPATRVILLTAYRLCARHRRAHRRLQIGRVHERQRPQLAPGFRAAAHECRDHPDARDEHRASRRPHFLDSLSPALWTSVVYWRKGGTGKASLRPSGQCTVRLWI